MLRLDTISSPAGTRKKSKRLGRGNGSGKGTFSWRGCKGQNARSGGGVPDWFEGGQTPLFRRMPKLKGFSNAVFKKHYNLVNLDDIEKIASLWILNIDKQTLLDAKIIRRKTLPVKLLGRWEVKTAVTLSVDIASKSAIDKIKNAWWSVQILEQENA